MTEAPYCPVCGNFLEDVSDVDGRCWSICPMAGLLQPAIHFAPAPEHGTLISTTITQKLRFYGLLTE